MSYIVNYYVEVDGTEAHLALEEALRLLQFPFYDATHFVPDAATLEEIEIRLERK